jgi:hypothetical protein
MSTIGGPGGIGGPSGPSGPGGIDGPDGPDGPDGADDVTDVASTSATSGSADIDALAAEIAAGRLTPKQAVDQLVETMSTAQGLDPAEQAELREMLTDLVASDPYLSGLANRV